MWHKTPENIKNQVFDLLKRYSKLKKNASLTTALEDAMECLKESYVDKDIYDIWKGKFPQQFKRYIGYSILIHKDLGVIAWGKEYKDFYIMMLNLDIDSWDDSEKAKTLITTIPAASTNYGTIPSSTFIRKEEKEEETKSNLGSASAARHHFPHH